MICGPAALSRFLGVNKPRPLSYEPRPMTYRASLFVLTVLAPITATAEQPVEFTAGLISTYDSNVLRLPDFVDSAPILGADKKADTLNQVNADVKVELPVGRQRFLFGADARRYFFGRLTGLNHTDTHAGLDWQWRVGHPLRGQLSHARDSQQTSFADNQGSKPDTRRLHNTQFQIEVAPAPDWRTIAEFRLCRGRPRATVHASLRPGHAARTTGTTLRYTAGQRTGNASKVRPPPSTDSATNRQRASRQFLPDHRIDCFLSRTTHRRQPYHP